MWTKNKSIPLPRFEPVSSNVYSSYYADYFAAFFSYGKGKFNTITCHEGTERSKGIVLLFFNFDARRVGWSKPHPGLFVSRKRRVTHYTGG